MPSRVVIRLAPGGGQPRLLTAREAGGAVEVANLLESCLSQKLRVGLIAHVVPVPPREVLGVYVCPGVGGEQNPTRDQRLVTLRQDLWELRAVHVKEARVGEDAVEGGRRQLEGMEVLQEALDPGRLLHHLDELGAGVEPRHLGSERVEVGGVAARPAAEVEHPLAFVGGAQCVQEGLAVLAHVVVLRARPERHGVRIVVADGGPDHAFPGLHLLGQEVLIFEIALCHGS